MLVMTDAVHSGHEHGLHSYCKESAGYVRLGQRTGLCAAVVRHRQRMVKEEIVLGQRHGQGRLDLYLGFCFDLNLVLVLGSAFR